MALVKVQWFQTETFEREIEVDGYDPADPELTDEDGPIMSQLVELAENELNDSFTGCTEREITGMQVVREGDAIPEIKAPRKLYEGDF